MAKRCFSVSELAVLLGAETVDSEHLIDGIGTLKSATQSQLSFLHNGRYQSQLKTSQAGAVLVSPEHRDEVESIALVVADPYIAYARATALFCDQAVSAKGNVSPLASVSESAVLADNVSVDAHAVIGDRAVINSGVSLGANSVVGADCVIGENTRIAANVTLYNKITIGANCVIHSGAVLGADGFGFANNQGEWIKIHQLGGVRLGDRVEVGANTTIDRGALDDTVIGHGVILDNQIQIAHNVIIGDNTAIAGCTAIAGSTRIGKNCTIAGACAITGHLTITDGTHITAMSLISKSILQAGAFSSGTVMEPHQQWKRNAVRFRHLDELFHRVKKLEKL
ncbi:UDP-3-O-(3-hydroxymyristoyl)glucosamine N-acyltransferase [Amphritea sp. 2_MG-2023]|uniref:UDP-3-O-(3-hydroxymyristoyl)glucosamine N-acyltransferase n=1 Tax=Amphritea TaxID=515417 RepID=UPI001C07DE2C|nr:MULTISPECIES: UDP-3-O-(3-hydroxymyristoyl)glucosamine N-acyltransferase [Amphritea]MBU2964893.1 UDP-3-O-(3-hydroxymyristoyl)glucosamine N-acyltransferase [Amphritea atlantica]MDO6419944.1 UDP-3-O-(3-hydroxymyristoyl)glucosamine N-acyltransferase [Amphritea sp. 2_MG-2023]